jgi:anaerobic selenocysteine-containing dehydrogenase
MSIVRFVGLSTRAERYAYAVDPEVGFTSARNVADAWVATTCGYCSVGCGMLLGTRDGRVVTVRGNPDHPVNRGWLCPEGLSEHHTLDAEGRATHPLLRRNGRLEATTWDTAIGAMARRFRSVQAAHGNGAVGVVSTGQLVTEEFYALGKLVQLGLGTSNYCGNTTLCMATAVAGYKASFGSDGPPGAYEDFEIADLIILIGANIADNHPILCRRLTQRDRGTLVVIDPRVTKTAMLADMHLAVNPRADLALINGLIHEVIRQGLVDRDYVERHTTGFEGLAVSVRDETPERVSRITGVAPGVIRRLAEAYAKAHSAVIAWTMGVNHSTIGTETVIAINNLALITGQIGRPGAAPFSITGQCNAMGTREAGFTSSMPGYRPFEDEAARRELAALWGVSEERLPSKRGLAYPDIIEAVSDGRIKALWIIGTNPAVSFPDHEAFRRAMEKLEFLVVQDGFHPTPTTELADLVLPAAIWGEKDGTYTNSERRVSRVRKGANPPGQARPDFDIVMALAHELGVADELFPGWNGPVDAFEEWRRVSAGRLCDYSGATWDAIEAHGGLQWPCPAGDAEPARVKRLYEDGRFPTPDGRARLLPTGWAPFPDQPDEQFPLILNTGRTVEHWHTRTKTGRVAILEELSPEAWVEINVNDARQLRIGRRDRVDVISRRGRIRNVRVRITEAISPGQVFVPFHYVEANANVLTQAAFDPVSREPNYKQAAVRVEKTR